MQDAKRQKREPSNILAKTGLANSTTGGMRFTWVALLRAINVGGSGRLPMAELRKVLNDSPKFDNARTYIQSGNVVFQSCSGRPKDIVSRDLADAVHENFGFRPPIVLLTPDELEQVISNNPYKEQLDKNPSTVHCFFTREAISSPNISDIDKAKGATESYEIVDSFLYLSAPDGIGRSKLVAKMDKLIGVPTTARNFRTLQKIRDIVDEVKLDSAKK